MVWERAYLTLKLKPAYRSTRNADLSANSDVGKRWAPWGSNPRPAD
jgi:hypothetical protein